MNLIEKIKQHMDARPSSPDVSPRVVELRQALEKGQRAKRAEDFALAREALGQAQILAGEIGDTSALMMVALNQVELLLTEHQLDEAEAVVDKALMTAEDTRQRHLIAYMLTARGMIAQERGDRALAQREYEKALEMARSGPASGAEGRALGLLADLYLQDQNASYATHLLREALPAFNLTGDIEPSAYFVGRLGQAMIATGQESEGLQFIERALRLARQIGYRRYERTWSMALAEWTMQLGRSEEAEAHLQYALDRFDGAAAGTPDHILALCQMTRVHLNGRVYEKALQHARQAVDFASQLNEPDSIAEAEAALGCVLAAMGEPQTALPYLKSALTAASRADRRPVFTRSDVLLKLAAVQAELGDDAAAINTVKEAAELASRTGNRVEGARVYREMGLFHLERKRPHDAIREWTQALAIYESEKQVAQAARLHCDLARIRQFVGQGQRATRDYEQALMMLSDLHDDWETRGLVLANAAITYAEQGDQESAESFFNESIAIARRLGDEVAEATRRGNYGWYMLTCGRPEQAVSLLEYALRQSQKLGLTLHAAVQTDNLGVARYAIGDYTQALDFHRQARQMIESLDEPHWKAIMDINEANTLLSLGEPGPVEQMFRNALQSGRDSEDAEVIIRALIGLAKLGLAHAKSSEVNESLDEAIMLARRADHRRLLAEALALASQQASMLGDQVRANTLWDEAQRYYAVLRSPQARLEPAWLKSPAAQP